MSLQNNKITQKVCPKIMTNIASPNIIKSFAATFPTSNNAPNPGNLSVSILKNLKTITNTSKLTKNLKSVVK